MLRTHRNLLRTQEKGRVVLTIWTVAYVVDKLLETYTCQFFFLNIRREILRAVIIICSVEKFLRTHDVTYYN